MTARTAWALILVASVLSQRSFALERTEELLSTSRAFISQWQGKIEAKRWKEYMSRLKKAAHTPPPLPEARTTDEALFQMDLRRIEAAIAGLGLAEKAEFASKMKEAVAIHVEEGDRTEKLLAQVEEQVKALVPTSVELRSQNPMSEVAINGDGTEAYTASSDSIQVWNAQSGARLREFVVSKVTSLSYSKLSGRLLAGCQNGTTLVIDPKSGNIEKTLPSVGMKIDVAAFSPDEKWIAIGYGDFAGSPRARVSLYNCEDDSWGPELNHNWRRLIGFSPDSRSLMTGAGNTVEVWNAGDWSKIRDFESSSSALFVADGRQVLAVSRDPTGPEQWRETLYDLATGEVVKTLKIPDRERLLAYSPGSGHLVKKVESGRIDSKLVLVDGPMGRVLAEFESERFLNAPVEASFSGDGQRLIYLGEQNKSTTSIGIASRNIVIKSLPEFLAEIGNNGI